MFSQIAFAFEKECFVAKIWIYDLLMLLMLVSLAPLSVSFEILLLGNLVAVDLSSAVFILHARHAFASMIYQL